MGCGKARQKGISAEDYNLQIIFSLCGWFLKSFACTFFVKMKWADELEAALLQLWWKTREKDGLQKTPVQSNFKTGTLSEAGKGETQGP